MLLERTALAGLICVGLTACATSEIEKRVAEATQKAADVAKDCNNPEVRSVSSPGAVKADFEQNIKAQFGLAPPCSKATPLPAAWKGLCPSRRTISPPPNWDLT